MAHISKTSTGTWWQIGRTGCSKLLVMHWRSGASPGMIMRHEACSRLAEKGWTLPEISGMRLPYDHKHRHISDKGVPYEFKDAHQLLSDFFLEVDRVLQEVRES